MPSIIKSSMAAIKRTRQYNLSANGFLQYALSVQEWQTLE